MRTFVHPDTEVESVEHARTPTSPAVLPAERAALARRGTPPTERAAGPRFRSPAAAAAQLAFARKPTERSGVTQAGDREAQRSDLVESIARGETEIEEESQHEEDLGVSVDEPDALGVDAAGHHASPARKHDGRPGNKTHNVRRFHTVKFKAGTVKKTVYARGTITAVHRYNRGLQRANFASGSWNYKITPDTVDELAGVRLEHDGDSFIDYFGCAGDKRLLAVLSYPLKCTLNAPLLKIPLYTQHQMLHRLSARFDGKWWGNSERRK